MRRLQLVLAAALLCILCLAAGFVAGVKLFAPQPYSVRYAESDYLRERGIAYGLPWDRTKIGPLYKYDADGDVQEIICANPFAAPDARSLLWRWHEEGVPRLLTLPQPSGLMLLAYDHSTEPVSGRVEWVPHEGEGELRVELRGNGTARARIDGAVTWEGQLDDLPEALDDAAPGGVQRWIDLWLTMPMEDRSVSR